MPTTPPNPRFQGWSNFGQSTPSRISVNNISAVLLYANPARQYVRINNNSGVPIYISYGTSPAIFGQGQPVGNRSSWVMPLTELYLGQINAITNQLSPVLIDVIEGE